MNKRGPTLSARVLNRLNADKALRANVHDLVALHGDPPTMTTRGPTVCRAATCPRGGVQSGMICSTWSGGCHIRSRPQAIRGSRRVVKILRSRYERLQDESQLEQLVSPLDGDQLMQLFNLPPGPWIKRVKEHLRELVIDGTLARDDQVQLQISPVASSSTRLLMQRKVGVEMNPRDLRCARNASTLSVPLKPTHTVEARNRRSAVQRP